MRTLAIILLFPLLAFAQEYEFLQELDSIPIEFEGYQLPYPWIGGYAATVPALCDIDADGLYEMIIGNASGRLTFYENYGTPQEPAWMLLDDQWLDIGMLGHTGPNFCDIDGDGDYDLFLETGNLQTWIYENVGTVNDPVFEVMEDTLKDVNGIPIDGTFGDLVDIDEDGDYDFFTGNWYTCTVDFYENIGDSSSYAFSLVTSNFAGISTSGDWNYLDFCDIDDDGDHDLFIGTDNGDIYYYRNDSTPPLYIFTCLSTIWLGVDVGDYANAEFCDIDADGDYDLFVGKDNYSDHNVSGDMQFWRNEGDSLNPVMVQENQMYLTLDVASSCEPDFVDYDHDGDMDIFVLYNDIALLKNIGSAENPSFQVLSLQMVGANFLAACCDFGDLDNDNDEDMVVAHGWTGIVEFWECDGDTSWPGFTELTQMTVGGLLGAPALGDIDADGDLDMLLDGGDYFSADYLYHFENQGTPERFNFVLVDSNFQGICMDEGVVPTLVDFDYDGDLDLMLGAVGVYGKIWYFENIGTPRVPNMVLVSQDLLGLGDIHTGYMAEFVDVDSDMDIDVFAGYIAGGIKFYRNITDEPQVGPKRPNGPPLRGNDVSLVYNPVTGITFNLPNTQNITLAVYNLLGRKVTTISSGRQPAGTHSFLWNPSQHASGVYIIHLETPKNTSSQRVMVVK